MISQALETIELRRRLEEFESLNDKMAEVLETVMDTFGVIERPMPKVKATLREVENVLAEYMEGK